MPNHSTYPDSADVERVIRSTGLFDTDALDAAILDLALEDIAGAASRQFEEQTGWIPFLKDSADVTRFFDPPGPNRRPHTLGGGYPLELGAGLLTLTSATTGITTTSAGTLAVLDDDFWLTPYNADELLRPWTALEFVVPQWGARRSIKIVGRWGYAALVPDDAWLAISHQAVAIALPEIATSISGGQNEFQELGVTERFPTGFLTGKDSLGERWAEEWRRTVRRYVRVVV